MIRPRRPAPPTFDRTPPQNIEAERSVLGAMLLNPDAVGAAIEILRYEGEAMFYMEQHQHIYDAMVGLFAKAEPIDAVTMIGKLSDSGKLQTAGGASYLAELSRCVPTSANVGEYARIVRDCAVLRKIIHTAKRASSEAYAAETPVEDVLARLQSEINTITEQKSSIEIVSAYTAAQELTVEVEEMIASGKKTRGLEIGIASIDSALYGFQKKNLIVLAARPGVGKTAFALHCVQYVAIQCGIPVLMFSKEMGREEIMMRVMQSQGDVYKERILGGWQARGEVPKMQAVTKSLNGVPFGIVDEAHINILDVKTISRRFAAKHNVPHGLIVIDYLQLLDPVDRRIPRQEQVAETSREAKHLAMELGWSVLALSQLNRKGDESDKQRPRMSHLRESGAIEQDANIIMLMHEEEGGTGPIANMSIDIAKNRGGAKGFHYMTYDKERQTFQQQSNMPHTAKGAVSQSTERPKVWYQDDYKEDDEGF